MADGIWIAGVSMTALGKRPNDSVKQLTAEAVKQALADAGAEVGQIDAAWFSNTRQPILEGQNSIRGQVALRPLGFSGIPIVNVENACASGSSALRQAISYLAAGEGDVALVVGAEKMFFPDRAERIAAAFLGGTDIYDLENTKAYARSLGADIDDKTNGDRSIFMDLYAAMALQHMNRYGTTQTDIAMIAAKNHTASQFNPKAQYRSPMTVAEVLADKPIAFPFTRSMCAPISDGAAAAVICTQRGLERLAGDKSRAVAIKACVLRSGTDHAPDALDQLAGRLTADAAYEIAGLDPKDIDVVEVHDASSFGELIQIENLRLAERGDVGGRLQRGDFALGGITPVNPSGGLVSKGHPVGVTGIGQIFELCLQLRDEAGARQVDNARIGVAENGGGFLRGEEAACVVTVLEGPAGR
jgi:acetyl-CoA acyltransferase